MCCSSLFSDFGSELIKESFFKLIKRIKERKLAVSLGYNEIDDENQFLKRMRSLLSEVGELRSSFNTFQRNTYNRIDTIIGKINSKQNDTALDKYLNNVLYQKLAQIRKENASLTNNIV